MRFQFAPAFGLLLLVPAALGSRSGEALFGESDFTLRPLHPPTAKELRIFHHVRSDTLQRRLCPVRNSSRAHCRDPRSYVHTNEARSFLFAPYIRNLRGALVAVGADAGYTFAGHARSEWVWLFDHDPVVVRLHFALRILIINSTGPARFVEHFRSDRANRAVALLKRHYHSDEALEEVIYVYRKYRAELLEHYRRSATPNPSFGAFGWLRNPEAFAHVRLLYRQDRVSILYGDLLKPDAMQSIGAAARRLGTTVRIFYPSNAEEYWAFTRTYRENVRSLPMDGRSVVLRSLSPHRVRLGRTNRWHPKQAGRYWHYVVHSGPAFQKDLADARFDSVDAWKQSRTRARTVDLSLIGVRER